jgi:hypothetical protein
MASPANATLCALIASVFWAFLGYGVGRHLLPRSLALGASPVLGWAVHSAALLPIVVWTGFSPLIVSVSGYCKRENRRIWHIEIGTQH